MKTKKTLAISLASLVMASVMALPTSAAKSSFTPTNTNFAPIFDFDSTPTEKYTVGYKPGKPRDTIGDGANKACIKADGIGVSYDLTICNGFKGKGLNLKVLDLAPEGGTWCPVSLNTSFGTKKFPGIPEGYNATDFMFWVDTTKYHDTEQEQKGGTAYKGIVMFIQENDFDAAGQLVKPDQATAWQIKSDKDGGVFYIEDQNGGWKQLKPNPSSKEDRAFLIPYKYKGWVKIPFSSFGYAQFTIDAKAVKDANKKFDARQIQTINLGMGNYERQKGSEVIFDEFGFLMEPIKTTTKATAGTTSQTKASDSTTAASDTTAAETTTTTEASTTIAETTTTISDTTVAAGPVEPGDNHTGLIITIIVIVVVLGGAGTGLFFFNKKVKNDGYSSIIDYFKNRKNTSEQ